MKTTPVLVTLRYYYQEEKKLETITRHFQIDLPNDYIQHIHGIRFISAEAEGQVTKLLRSHYPHPRLQLQSRHLSLSKGILNLSCEIHASLGELRDVKLNTLLDQINGK